MNGQGQRARDLILLAHNLYPRACSAGIWFYSPTRELRNAIRSGGDCRRRYRAFIVHQMGNEY